MVSTNQSAATPVRHRIFLKLSSVGMQNRHVLLGLDTADVTAKLAFNFHPAEMFSIKPVSLHIIVPGIGRRSIFRLLSSLKPQLEPQVIMRPAVVVRHCTQIQECCMLCHSRSEANVLNVLFFCRASMQDHVTVVFDGVDNHNILEEVKRELASMPGRPPINCATL